MAPCDIVPEPGPYLALAPSGRGRPRCGGAPATRRARANSCVHSNGPGPTELLLCPPLTTFGAPAQVSDTRAHNGKWAPKFTLSSSLNARQEFARLVSGAGRARLSSGRPNGCERRAARPAADFQFAAPAPPVNGPQVSLCARHNEPVAPVARDAPGALPFPGESWRALMEPH